MGFGLVHLGLISIFRLPVEWKAHIIPLITQILLFPFFTLELLTVRPPPFCPLTLRLALLPCST